MDPSPAATAPQAGRREASTARENDGRPQTSGGEARPSVSARPGSIEWVEPLVRRDKDVIEDCHLERRDTAESSVSDYYPRRTNTDWSVAASTATDLTDPNSPDAAFADEGLDAEAESYPSSPRRSSFFPAAIPLRKRLPFRVPPPLSCSDAGKAPELPCSPSPDTPALRHRRLEQIGLYKPSLRRNTGPDASNQIPTPSALRSSDSSGDDGAGDDLNGDQPGSSAFDTSGSSDPQTQRQTTEEAAAGEEDVQEPETGSKTEPVDDVPTPELATAEAASPSTPEPSAGARERPSSSGSEASEPREDDGDEDEDDDDDEQSTPRPDDSTIHEVCDQVLQQAFGIQLQDLAFVGAASAAYESISHCLDELSRIVLNSGVGNAGIVTSQAAPSAAGSATTPIRSAGSDADHGGAAGGSSGASGNGGSGRKRFNDARDGSGPGGGTGGDTPDGGKRLKVSPQRPSDEQSDSVRYSCPFRKRNPVRFNIRDFQACAVQGFPDIPQLKRHVKQCHKQKAASGFVCPRCRRDMGSRTALDEHLAVDKDQICNFQQAPSSADPEDGITSSIEDTLNDRKAANKIDCWGSLWHLLFPQDPKVPTSDFIPPTELDEVYAQFNSQNCIGQLRQRIQDGLGSDNDVEVVFDIFQKHIESVFEECRLKTGGAAGGRRRMIRPQTPREMTSRQSSMRLTPAHHRRQGSGFSDSNISSPYVATPQSAGILGNSDLLLTAEPQSHMPYVPSMGGYASSTAVGVTGLVSTPLLPAWIPPTSKGSQPVTMPPPPHVPLGLHSQLDTLKGQLGHATGLLPVNPGADLIGPVFSNQTAGAFSPHVPQAPASRSYNGWGTMPGFAQRRTPDLHLQVPSQPEMQALQGQGISPTDAVMVPSFEFTGYDESVTNNDGFEVVGRQNEWA